MKLVNEINSKDTIIDPNKTVEKVVEQLKLYVYNYTYKEVEKSKIIIIKELNENNVNGERVYKKDKIKKFEYDIKKADITDLKSNKVFNEIICDIKKIYIYEEALNEMMLEGKLIPIELSKTCAFANIGADILIHTGGGIAYIDLGLMIFNKFRVNNIWMKDSN